MSISSGELLVDLACSKIKDADVLHRGFLKPFEIQLKTYQTQKDQDNSILTPNSLPAGLKIVVKQSILNNKYTLHNIQPIVSEPSYEQLKQKHQDNILTLMKDVSDGLELAICICMYSEDRKMLKSTLAGVTQNISNLVSRQRINSDKIGVFVIMDGIQKVDQSVVEYFQELERINDINLGTNIMPDFTIQEIARRSKMTTDQINQEETKNVNNFLFNSDELKQRNQRRFSSVYQDYHQIKKLLETIERLKKQKPLFDDLPRKLHPFFIKQAQQKHRTQNFEEGQPFEELQAQYILNQYTNDIRKIRPLISITLSDGQRYCHQYINSREELAYLASFRMKVPHKFNQALIQQRERQEGIQQNSFDQLKQSKLHTYMNLFLCVKYKNSGKLSSHNWFFNGFCKQLKPKYTVLLDVGLKPEGQALQNMYRYMKKNDHIGGVCGYMSLKIEKLQQSQQINQEQVDLLTSIALKFVDIQRTQQVQYHFAHLIDKPFQASFGFIHVLPGAFSAYNMKAIIRYDQADDDKLLKSYFKSIDEKIKNTKIVPSPLSFSNVLLRLMLPDLINSYFINIDPQSQEQMLYNQNLYLAEDRILCMGIYKKGFTMAYLPDVFAEVDPIRTVPGLLGQRKRWNNGSYFAFQKVKRKLKEHAQEKGSCEFMLRLQIFYLTLMSGLSYFSPSFYLFSLHLAMDALRSDLLTLVFGSNVPDLNNSSFYKGFVGTIDFVYVLLIFSAVFFSLYLTNSNKKFRNLIYTISTLLGIFSILVLVILLLDMIKGLQQNSGQLINNDEIANDIPGGAKSMEIMRWILIGLILVYALPVTIYALLFKSIHVLWEVILGSLSFIFYGPTYLIFIYIYSLCRIDDISWGTKGLDSIESSNSKLKDSWRLFKFVHVGKYIFWNVILSTILLSVGSQLTPRFFITFVMVAIMGFSLGIKILLGIFYIIKYKILSIMHGGNELNRDFTENSRVQNLINSYKVQIISEIRSHLKIVKSEYYKIGKVRSTKLIKVNNKDTVEQTVKKQRQIYQNIVARDLKPGKKQSFSNKRYQRQTNKKNLQVPFLDQTDKYEKKVANSYRRITHDLGKIYLRR